MRYHKAQQLQIKNKDMGHIKLENIRLYAYHGCMAEEAVIGSNYRVDLDVKADLRQAAISDDLKDTVDYVLLNRIVFEEMAIRSKLLEHVGQRIINRLFNEAKELSYIKIGVCKLNPPIDGDVESVQVILEDYRT